MSSGCSTCIAGNPRAMAGCSNRWRMPAGAPPLSIGGCTKILIRLDIFGWKRHEHSRKDLSENVPASGALTRICFLPCTSPSPAGRATSSEASYTWLPPRQALLGSRRLARSPLLLLEAYRGIARSILERKREHARHAQGLLEEARAEADYDWWKEQFPSTDEVAWKIEEYEAIRGLLRVIARFVDKQSAEWEHERRKMPISTCHSVWSLDH